MFFFKRKARKNISFPSQYTLDIINALGLRYEYFEPSSDDKKLLAAYKKAQAKGVKEGFIPIILCVNSILAEWFTEIVDYGGKSLDEYRKDIISKAELIDGKAWLSDRIKEFKEVDDDEGYYAEIWNMSELKGGEESHSFSAYKHYETGEVQDEILIVYVPATIPYEVFAWLPFGGWNECPNPDKMIAVSRYWYEKCGAVPAVIKHDIIEYTARPLSEKDAIEVSQEHYAFCQDIVDQGYGGLSALADSLTKSTVWYFWWD